MARRILRIITTLAEQAVFGLAVFTGLNLVLNAVSPRLGCNWIWINLADKPGSPGWLLLLFFVIGVLGWRWARRGVRLPIRVVVGVVGVICLRDAAAYYWLLASGIITSAFPVPLSLLLGVLLMWWAAYRPKTEPKPGLWPRLLRVGLAVWAAGLCLLAQVLTFGSTDYSRPGDAIIVFGAGVYPDGSPSLALYDRTVTACDLYRRGLAGWLVLSGGRNPAAPIGEPEAMKRIAVKAGVPAERIILDERGVNTAATIANAATLARERGWRRVLMVSHNYHLSRISMLSHRAGLAACTIPAHETRPLMLKPYYVQRELAAWVYYYLK